MDVATYGGRGVLHGYGVTIIKENHRSVGDGVTAAICVGVEAGAIVPVPEPMGTMLQEVRASVKENREIILTMSRKPDTGSCRNFSRKVIRRTIIDTSDPFK